MRKQRAGGLPNIDNTVDAYAALTDSKAIELFERHNVMTRYELASREEVGYETYAKTINVEARTMIDMAKKEILPAVIHYTTTVAQSVNAVKAAGADASVSESILNQCLVHMNEMNSAIARLEQATAKAAAMAPGREQAVYYRDAVIKEMDALRKPADALEMLVDEKEWPFPTYAELMFNV